jgi:GNAT superfamily N-acetyltransferase
MTTIGRPAGRREGTSPAGVQIRPATEAEVPGCAEIWRAGVDDYLVRLNQPPVEEDTSRLTRLHAHARATDPERFLVAEREGRIVAFGSAVVRDRVWFLSMLFVRPAEQGAGIGRAILSRLLPDDREMRLATATDSLQPISNGLYATLGIVPRTPLIGLTGLPERPAALGDLPAGIEGTSFEEVAATDGEERLTTVVDELDRESAGFSHPQDHAWIRAEGRIGYLFRDRSGTALGYGYAARSGRLGPIAVRDAGLFGPVLGHLMSVVPALGAYTIWVPGLAGDAAVPLLRAGFRLDGFPLLLCWDRPFGDISRYVPISPGLL